MTNRDSLKHNIEELLNEKLSSSDIKTILNKISLRTTDEIIDCIDNINNISKLIIIKSALNYYNKTNKLLIGLFNRLCLIVVIVLTSLLIFADINDIIILLFILLSAISTVLFAIDISNRKQFDMLIDIMINCINRNIEKLILNTK